MTLLEQAGHPHLWSLLAGFALNTGYKPEEAASFVRRALELSPTMFGAHQMLSNALERAGDMAGAIEAQREEVKLNPHVAPFAARLAELQARL